MRKCEDRKCIWGSYLIITEKEKKMDKAWISKHDNICTYWNKFVHAYKDVGKLNLVWGGEVCIKREELGW